MSCQCLWFQIYLFETTVNMNMVNKNVYVFFNVWLMLKVVVCHCIYHYQNYFWAVAEFACHVTPFVTKLLKGYEENVQACLASHLGAPICCVELLPLSTAESWSYQHHTCACGVCWCGEYFKPGSSLTTIICVPGHKPITHIYQNDRMAKSCILGDQFCFSYHKNNERTIEWKWRFS